MFKKNLNLIILVVFLVLISVLSRFISHAWNFTILGGVALFSGAFFAKKSISVTVILLSLVISDAIIGFHNQMLVVYFSFLLMLALGSFLSLRSSRLVVVSTSVLASFLFFLVTNFFVWFEGFLYPQTFNGLFDCYLMAIPFFRNQIISDVVSSVVLFEVAKSLKTYFATKFDSGFIKSI